MLVIIREKCDDFVKIREGGSFFAAGIRIVEGKQRQQEQKGGFAGSDMEKGDSLSLPPDWFGFALLTVLPAAGNPLPHP